MVKRASSGPTDQTMPTELSQRGSEYLLMLVLGAFHTGMQGINLLRGYAYAQLEGRTMEVYPLLRETASAWLIGLAFIFLIVRTTRLLLWQQWS
jgi:hypothetical protein